MSLDLFSDKLSAFIFLHYLYAYMLTGFLKTKHGNADIILEDRLAASVCGATCLHPRSGLHHRHLFFLIRCRIILAFL